MKILVSIPDYRGNQMEYLNKVIDEYKSYKKYDVTINVHSTVLIPRSDINLIQYDPLKTTNLVYKHRQEFIDNRDNYDLYLFSENDILIKEETIDIFLKYQNLLPENYCIGFLRYEKRPIEAPDDKNLYCIDVWPNTGDILHPHIEINNTPYFLLKNPFQSCFLLTNTQLNYTINNSQFTKSDWPVAPIETASAGVYKNWEHSDGVINKVWIRNEEDLEKCLIHHTSNVHCDFPHPYKYLGNNYHTTTRDFYSLVKELNL